MNEASMTPLPMRKAAEQFRLAGCNTCLLTVNAADNLHYVDGIAGRAVMTAEGWREYKALCAQFEASPQDLEGVDPFAMQVLDPKLTTGDLYHIIRAVRCESRQVQALIQTAATTLSVEDYGDALKGAEARQASVLKCLDQLHERLQRELPMMSRGELLPRAEETTTENTEHTEGRDA